MRITFIAVLILIFTILHFVSKNIPVLKDSLSRIPASDCNGVMKRTCDNDETFKVHLTFDDGPGRYTHDVLRILKEEDVPSTFFVMAQQANQRPGIIDRIKNEGHGVHCHGWVHRPHTQSQQTLDSVAKCTENDKLGNLFRLPGGDGWGTGHQSGKARVKRKLDELGLQHVGWHINSRDQGSRMSHRGQVVSNHTAHILEQICEVGGGVILAHDTSHVTKAKLREWIQAIRCSGHQFAPIEEFLGDPYLNIDPSNRYPVRTQTFPTESQGSGSDQQDTPPPHS